MRDHARPIRRAARTALIVTAGVLLLAPGAPAARQQTFASPDAAVAALVAAAEADDTARILAVFGPEGREVISSGDPVEDEHARERFVRRARERTHLERVGDDFAVLSVGNDDWPCPIPLMRNAAGWYFDTAAGRQEILRRRSPAR